jgi:hypothetical protein
MKSHFVCLLAWAGLSASLCAQDAKIAPLPDGPLLKRVPDFAAWNVTDQGSLTTGSGSSSADGGADKKTVSQAKFIKTGSTIFEQSVDSEGRSQEIWRISGMRVAKISGISSPIVCPDFGGGDIFSIDFSVSDFAGLDWVSKDSYAGIIKYQGRDCILFKSEVSPLSRSQQGAEAARIASEKAEGLPVDAETPKIPAIAYIDSETRLPILVAFGGQRRSYQYNSPPTEKLSPPLELAGPYKAYLQRLKRVSAPPARAY